MNSSLHASETSAVMAGVSDIVKEKMRSVSRSLSGEYFLGSNERLIRFRRNSAGRLTALPSQVISGVSSRLAGPSAALKAQGQKTMRRVVTGDPDRRIRDYIKEVPQVKFIDKLSFMFGVTCIAVTEFIVLRHPVWFTTYHVSLMAVLLTYRLQDYWAQNCQLFLLDFCYFMNLSVILQTGLYPDDLLWFKANYVLCMGTLMTAIIMWNNSLVFHSLDKLTSFFLHFFPPLHLHLFRWGLIPCSAILREDTLATSEIVLLPVVLVLVWQLAYLLITEVFLGKALASDPTLVTSMRHLAGDNKNVMNQVTRKTCRTLGIMTRDETFDTSSIKTKTTFVVAQVLYTFVTLLPTPLLYSSYNLSLGYFVFIFMFTAWRGGSYYIEVFSERYNLKFEKREKSSDNTARSSSTNNSEEEAEDQDLLEEMVEAMYAAEKSEAAPKSDSDGGEVNEDQEERDKEDKRGDSDSSEPALEEPGRSWEELSTPL